MAACSTEPKIITPDASIHPDVLASFLVELSEPLPPNAGLSLEWVDALTTHNLNPTYTPMQAVDNLHYQLDAPAKKGQMLQYRYVLTGAENDIELGPDEQPIHSRYFYITDHSRIQDKILGFISLSEGISTGSIEGTVTISGTDQPAAGVILTTAGIAATSTIDGHFRLQGIPVGTQNITIFSPDGALEPFQQQAVIEKDTLTPIDVSLETRKLVNVTFIVTTPKNTPPLAALRLFGNLATLGDSFAGLYGGTDLIQDRAVILARQAENEYLAVLQLPVGTEIQYSYSLGDTFWNRELNSKGITETREFFVPEKDIVVEDRVASWDTVNYQPLTFQFLPPANTSAADRIQIQFNAYGWMEPLEMWPVGDGTYEFQLFSPLNFSKSVDYRFCRSEICGTQDSNTQQNQLLSFQAGSTSQVLPTLSGIWAGWSPNMEPTIVTTEQTTPRTEDFHTIVELSTAYRPSWLSYYGAALDAVTGLNANTLILPVTWTFRSANPVWLDLNLSQDPSIQDIAAIVALAKSKGLQVYLMAATQYSASSKDFWEKFIQDSSPWDQWFQSMFGFYQSASHLAKSTQADGVILGDSSISSILSQTNSLPGVFDSYPDSGTQKWNEILSQIRSEYPGKILLALNFDDLQVQDSLASENLDGYYVLNLGQISETKGDVKSYTGAVTIKLDETLAPLQSSSGKQIWLGLDYPSISSSYLGCVDIAGQCIESSVLDFPSPNQPEISISLQEQADIYNAVIPEANRRGWLNGVATRRYLALGNYQDQSSSIRGKPAADIIWYWFSAMTGQPTQ